MLTGEYVNTLDDKGRLLLPSRLRSSLSETELVLTKGVEGCLWLFVHETWDRFSSALIGNSSILQAQARQLRRRIIAPAQPVEIDKAGRISIPASLRDYAGLKKETVVLGLENYIEIWDEESYKAMMEEGEDAFLDVAETLGQAMPL